MNCHACSAPLSEGARFCHKCGAATSSQTAAGWRVGLPWGIAGLAVGALLAVLLLRGRGGGVGEGTLAGQTSLGGALIPGGIAASDISQMSPEERAQRLFDRVMRLGEEGKLDSVQFFLPMALGAYQQLPALSLDSHFDIGMLRLAGGDAPGAIAEADAIRQLVPTHLFASVLRAHALQAQNDAAGARRAYLEFLKNETAERARRRPEYEEHGRILEAFRTEALSGTGR